MAVIRFIVAGWILIVIGMAVYNAISDDGLLLGGAIVVIAILAMAIRSHLRRHALNTITRKKDNGRDHTG